MDGGAGIGNRVLSGNKHCASSLFERCAILVRTTTDTCFPLSGFDAIDQMDAPAFFDAVDPHDNFGISREMIDAMLENQKVGAQLSDRENLAIHPKLASEVGRISDTVVVFCIHG